MALKAATDNVTSTGGRNGRTKTLGDQARGVVRRGKEGNAEIQDKALASMEVMFGLPLTPEQREALTPAFKAVADVVRIAADIVQMDTYLLADNSAETNNAVDNYDAGKRERSERKKAGR